jgi:mitogen-activated protein kinase kinase kinase ANP1
MGSGCCKSEDANQVTLSKASNIKSLNILQARDPTEFTLVDSEYPTYRTILWKRGDIIGQGVYGKVYQAMNIDTGELLAVKTYSLSVDEAKIDKELMNIKRELSILRCLDHPNIIKYFQADYSVETDSIDILMEYIPSGCMNSLIKKYKSFGDGIIRNYTKQLLEGLNYLHSFKIVHRDLKSANILITEYGTLKLTDFGCSRRFDSDISPQSQSFKGSPYWMAPEVVLHLWHSYPADIWSLGCLVIEMASGRPPWSNYSLYSHEVLKLISKPNNLPDIPKVSEDLNDFILSCLRRRPEDRLTAKELLDHKFIRASGVAKCYDSIRTSNNLTQRSVGLEKPADKNNEL